MATTDRDNEWAKKVKDEVDKIRVQAAVANRTITDSVLEEAGYEGGDRPPQTRPSWIQNQMMQSMERNLTKLPFEFVGHGVYITAGQPRGPFFTSVRWMWKGVWQPDVPVVFASPTLAQPLRLSVAGLPRISSQPSHCGLFRLLPSRGGFHTPWIIPTNILTVEELATLWHPPSRTSQVPGLERIPATKSAPPANLPK